MKSLLVAATLASAANCVVHADTAIYSADPSHTFVTFEVTPFVLKATAGANRIYAWPRLPE